MSPIFIFVIIPLCIIVSYLIGSLPTAYLVVRGLLGIDIRTVGSGNVGTTNTYRAAGLKGTVIVFCVDVLKGFISAFAAYHIAQVWGVNPSVFGLFCGICAVAGHMFPVWLQFKGGKGAATGFGILLALVPIPALIAIAFWAAVLLVTRYVSLATIVAALVMMLQIIIRGGDFFFNAILFAVLIFIIYKHKDNIKRLLKGTELKFGKNKSQ